MARSRLHRRYKRNRSNPDGGYKSNPPLFQDVFEQIGPAFVGFVATRFVSRMAAVQIAKYRPQLGKHGGVAASLATFLAAWFFANKWKPLAKYQMPLIVGSGIAAAQSILQLYLPRIGWTVGDPSGQIAAMSRQQFGPNPADLQPVDDDPNEYVYNDSYDPGRMDQTQTSADQSAPAAPSQSTEADDLSDLDMDELGQTQSMGIFSNSN